MGHVCPSGVTARFSHGLHDYGEQSARAPGPPRRVIDPLRRAATRRTAGPPWRSAAPIRCRRHRAASPPAASRRRHRAASPPAASRRPPTSMAIRRAKAGSPGLMALRDEPRRAADPIPSVLGSSRPHLVTLSPHRPLSHSQSAVPSYSGRISAISSHAFPRPFRPFRPLRLFRLQPFPPSPSSPPAALSRPPFSTPPEFWTVLQVLAPVFDISPEFCAVFRRIVWQSVCKGKLATL